MGKVDAAVDVDPGAAAGAPHGAREIAEAVDREHGGALERRDVEGAGEMGQMVLDVVEARLEPGGVGAEGGGEQASRAFDPRGVLQARADQLEAWSVDDAEQGLPEQVRPGIAVDRDVVEIVDRDAGLVQAIADRLGGEARPVLDAAKPFFLRGGDDPAVAKEAGGGVGVEAVETENEHGRRHRAAIARDRSTSPPRSATFACGSAGAQRAPAACRQASQASRLASLLKQVS